MTQATTPSGTELATRPDQHLATADDFMPAMNIEQAIARYNAVIDFTKRVMKPGRDYGTIPGTERKSRGDDGTPSSSNNTLLKPGAEKLCTLFGLTPRFEDYRVIEDWTKGIFYFAFRCVLSRNGRVIAEGIGSANSREKKYRRESRLCPSCSKPAIKKSKYPPRGAPKGTPGGWYCESKSGGCGAEFAHDDPAVVAQAVVNDPDAAADQVNTLQKMAQKRALVAATLIATNASEFFTQDAEDMAPVERGGEVIDGEFVDVGTGELRQPTFDDDNYFLAKWDEQSDAHTLDRDTGRQVLRAKLGRTAFCDADVSFREKLLGDYRNATVQQIEQVKQRAKAAEVHGANPGGANAPASTTAGPATAAPATASIDAGAQEDDEMIRAALDQPWEDSFQVLKTAATESLGVTGNALQLLISKTLGTNPSKSSTNDRVRLYKEIRSRTINPKLGWQPNGVDAALATA